MPTLSAFADEVSQDPQGQIEVLKANDIRYLELRSAYDTNVVDLTDEQCRQLQSIFSQEGVSVSCIASPVGKIRLDEDAGPHFDKFKRAVELAELFGAKYLRIFSFYPPPNEEIANYRKEVLDRLGGMIDYVGNRAVTLVLENESNLFGSLPERCVYLMSALGSEKLCSAFDPANFVNMDVADIYRTCWLPLRPYVGYFHIKDFKYGQRDHAVPAGQGDGEIPAILADARSDGYDGFLALEPHLGQAKHSTGVTGPEQFKQAADALKRICGQLGWAIE